MRATLAPVAFAALAAAIPNPVPQAVTSSIAPSSSAPAGCSTSHSGTFEIQVVNVTSSSSKRDVQKRQTDDSTLTLTLSGGILTDSNGRTGYIASNNQFQFDKPPQAGAIYTAGWSLCSNNSMALGGNAVFYQCLSGTFYNLYDKSSGAQCNEVTIQAIGGSSGSGSAPASAGTSTAVATEQTDGQPTASPVSQISDGQPQASTAAAVSQISDGQPQASTAAAVSQISDGQPQATTGAAVSQISDGQPQATTGAAVSQISDGQPQATTGAAVSQISDGQPQATTGAAVSQISDGQPQATTGAAVSQISDGQPQATTGGAVSQISDGQPQAATSASVEAYTGAAMPTAAAGRGELFGLAAGVLAVAML